MGSNICCIGVPVVRGEGHDSILGVAGGPALQKSMPGGTEGAWQASNGQFLSS